jgi:hypothetical protein
MTFRSHRSSRRGQAAVLVTMTLVMSMALIGLVVDFGWAYYRKVSARAAAESAALGAAITASNKTPFCVTLATCQSSTNCPSDPPSPPVTNIDAGCLYAKKNGFRTAGNQTVAITAGKNGGTTSTTADYYVTATITENLPQLFSRVGSHNTATVSVRSTAGVFLHPAAACIYALAPAGTGFSIGGTITIQSGCGIYVDSNDATSAMTGGGNSKITASQINVVGGFNPNGGTTISPTPTTGVQATTDPLASRSAPDVPTSCDISGISAGQSITMPASGTIRVCGDFTLNSNQTTTIPGGTYVLSSGAINWKNGTLRATGPVTFYMTGTFTGITINGNMDVQLNAPPTGALRGMLFFLDRSITLTGNSVTMNGGSNMLLNGSLYFPTSDIKYSGGNATSNEYTALIAQHINFIGNSFFKADIGGGFNGLGAPTINLLE